MAQTFNNWSEVPASIETKIRKIWNGDGASTFENSRDANGREITVYKLSDYKVIFNTDFLTDAQKIKFFNLAWTYRLNLADFLHNLTFEPECVRIYDEVYHIPGIVVGTWPHCNLYGGMGETGHIHT